MKTHHRKHDVEEHLQKQNKSLRFTPLCMTCTFFNNCAESCKIYRGTSCTLKRKPSMQEHTCLGADTYDPEDIATYPHDDFLHTLTPSHLPPHELRLKIGMPIMMIRTLDQAAGKADGTICIFMHTTKRNLQPAKRKLSMAAT
ncbi:TPA: hypothetical protein ACH3X1_012563 [Trebouxia sp. C0004]